MNDEGTTRRVPFDYWLLLCTLLLVGLGVVMVYSASAVLAGERYGDPAYFLKRESCFVLLGLAGMTAAARCPYPVWRRVVYGLLALSALLLGCAYIPGIRSTVGGASRWIHLGPVRFQPSELAKLTIVIFLAYSLEKKAARMKSFAVGLFPHMVIGGIMIVLILGQRDFGSAFLVASILFCMLLVGGSRLTYLGAMVIAALPLLYFAVASVDYRRKRILAFLNPWSDRYGSGFQIIQSLIAFKEGGLLGRGLGEGQQKLFYLPEAHTDFIASVIGEELGLIGMLCLLALYGFFCLRGFMTAWRAPDSFGRYLAFGITVLLSWQAVCNLGVVMGLLPTKGMVLPFVSYGGSSLLVSLVAVGIMLNISSYRKV
ncbi:MAG: putative lipid II flippase FtsW [Deltaproteobacteria bacterium]|nr:putative lipid II flippase FtsW [Deltaproteobacteria bacterium]